MSFFEALFALCISLNSPSTLMDSAHFHAAKYFKFHYENIMEANKMDVGDEDSRHSSANPSGLHHPNKNLIYIVAIIFYNESVNR